MTAAGAAAADPALGLCAPDPFLCFADFAAGADLDEVDAESPAVPPPPAPAPPSLSRARFVP